MVTRRHLRRRSNATLELGRWAHRDDPSSERLEAAIERLVASNPERSQESNDNVRRDAELFTHPRVRSHIDRIERRALQVQDDYPQHRFHELLRRLGKHVRDGGFRSVADWTP
jgi:hypothetical protein